MPHKLLWNIKYIESIWNMEHQVYWNLEYQEDGIWNMYSMTHTSYIRDKINRVMTHSLFLVKTLLMIFMHVYL